MSSGLVRREPLKVIVDSNAMFVPLQFRIDIFSELEKLLNRNFDLILLSSVKHELETLAVRGSPRMRKNASFALKFSEKCKYVDVGKSPKVSTDDVIVEIASEWNSPVFTNDRQLRNRLRDISVPVIYVRQKSRLQIDGMI
jgi:rRNA-processing protein FCF1